jgi:predicted regulator of amino acid metabolism with ACT domain
MWNRVESHFINFPAQMKVAKLLFEKGFQVRENGKIVTDGIEIAHSQIARAVGVDRRAVDHTVETILSKHELKRIYANLKQVCSLQDVAHEFNLGVIVFIPEDAQETGIIASVTKKISERGLSIRQALAEDPTESTNPKLTLIIEGDIPSELINDIRKLPGTRSITIY